MDCARFYRQKIALLCACAHACLKRKFKTSTLLWMSLGRRVTYKQNNTATKEKVK